LKAYAESWVRSEDAAKYLKKHYLFILCEGVEGCPKRITVEGWKGKKSKAIIFAKPKGLEESRAAARHPHVDGVSFGKGTLRFFDDSQASLMFQFGKVAEFRINEAVTDHRYLSDLRKAVKLALVKDVPVTFTCAPQSLFEVCVPFQIISLLEGLGIPEEDAKALWALGSNYLLSLVEAKQGMRKVLRSDG